MTNKKIYSIIEEQEQYKNIMRKKIITHKKNLLKKQFAPFATLAGFKMQEIVKVRMYSRDRLVFAGIDLLHLQFAIVILSEKLKLTVDY